MTPFEKTVVRLMRSRSTWIIAIISLVLLVVLINGLGHVNQMSNHPILSPHATHAIPRQQVTEVGLHEIIRKTNFELSSLQGELLQVLTATADPLVSYNELDQAMERIQRAVASNKQRITILRVPRHAEEKRERYLSSLTNLENKLVQARAIVATGERDLIRKEINDLFHTLDRVVLGF